MAVFRVGPLPEQALDAAERFHTEVLPKARSMLSLIPPGNGEDLVLIFPPASHDHRSWRLAAVQDLARAASPSRVNAIVGDDETAIAEALAYLETAPGITGQLLAVG